MKSETFRKQALSLIVFFVAIAAVFALTRLRSDPAGKQAQTILTQLLSSSDAVEPAADDSYTASEPGLVQVDDGGFAAFYQAQFGDCMTQQCLENSLRTVCPPALPRFPASPRGSPCKSAPVPTTAMIFPQTCRPPTEPTRPASPAPSPW